MKGESKNMYLKNIAQMSRNFTAVILAALVFAFAYSVCNEVSAEEAKKDPHVDIFAEDNYPSASQCAGCHKKIYRE